MKNVSIECARSYDAENDDSLYLDELGKLLRDLDNTNQTYSLVLLVDDISYADKSFDFDSYARWLGGQGFTNANIYWQSQITSACNEVSKLIEPKLGVISASPLYIAAWSLLRLGYLEIPSLPAELQAEKLVNILPIDFKSDDDESLEIIKATPFARALNQIEYRFIPS